MLIMQQKNTLAKTQININPENYEKTICNRLPFRAPDTRPCGGEVFQQVFEIRKIPKFQAQTLGVQQELLIARWKCLKCGNLLPPVS